MLELNWDDSSDVDSNHFGNFDSFWGSAVLLLVLSDNIVTLVSWKILCWGSRWFTVCVCCFQDPVEEERGGRLRGHHLLHLLQQHTLPGARHHRLLLPAQELQPHRVSFKSRRTAHCMCHWWEIDPVWSKVIYKGLKKNDTVDQTLERLKTWIKNNS